MSANRTFDFERPYPLARCGSRVIVLQAPVSRIPTVKRIGYRLVRGVVWRKVNLSVINASERALLIDYARYGIGKRRRTHTV